MINSQPNQSKGFSIKNSIHPLESRINNVTHFVAQMILIFRLRASKKQAQQTKYFALLS